MNQRDGDPKIQRGPIPEVKILKWSDRELVFDIIEFCKSTKIQISYDDYLKSNPSELDILIEYVRGYTLQNMVQ